MNNIQIYEINDLIAEINRDQKDFNRNHKVFVKLV